MPDQSGFPDPVGLATHKDDRMGELVEWAESEEAAGRDVASILSEIGTRARTRFGLEPLASRLDAVDHVREFAFVGTKFVIRYDDVTGWRLG